MEHTLLPSLAMDVPALYVTGFGVGTTLVSATALRVVHGLLHRRAAAKRTPAESFVLVGQVLAAWLVSAAAVHGAVEGDELVSDLRWVAALGAVGLVLLVGAGELGARLLLSSHLDHEVRRGNVAAGVAAGAVYAATGIVASAAIGGRGVHELALSVGFFLLGIATLHVLGVLFRALTVYDDAEQVRGENVAAALSYGGAMLAFALVIGRALEGSFTTWSDSLRSYGEVLLGCLALYPVRQLIVQSLLLGAPLRLRGGRIDEAVGSERNVAVAALEATTYLATALAIHRLA